MRRCILLLTLSAVTAAAAFAGSRFGIAIGISPQAGIMYAGAGDVGYSGTSAEIAAFYASGLLHLEGGIEAGASPIGWQVLAPLRGGVGWERGQLEMEALLELDPGAALFQQGPLLLLGGGILGRIAWSLGPSFSVYATAGVRLTACPAYGSSMGIDYTTLDLPLAIGVRWNIGR